MLVMEDMGELVYGGAVTFAEWWDNKRIQEAKIANKDVFKKAGFYTYLVIGGFATMASAFGWLRRYDAWTTHISHGFIYDLPRFGYNTVQALKKTTAGTGDSAALQEAQRILREARAARALGSGRETQRTYEPEYSKAGVL